MTNERGEVEKYCVYSGKIYLRLCICLILLVVSSRISLLVQQKLVVVYFLVCVKFLHDAVIGMSTTFRLAARWILTILNDFRIMASKRRARMYVRPSEGIKRRIKVKVHRTIGHYRSSPLVPDTFFHVFRNECVPWSGVEIAHIFVYQVISTIPAGTTRHEEPPFCINYHWTLQRPYYYTLYKSNTTEHFKTYESWN